MKWATACGGVFTHLVVGSVGREPEQGSQIIKIFGEHGRWEPLERLESSGLGSRGRSLLGGSSSSLVFSSSSSNNRWLAGTLVVDRPKSSSSSGSNSLVIIAAAGSVDLQRYTNGMLGQCSTSRCCVVSLGA